MYEKTIAHGDEDVPKVAQPACGRARGDSQDPKPAKYYLLAKLRMNCQAVFSRPLPDPLPHRLPSSQCLSSGGLSGHSPSNKLASFILQLCSLLQELSLITLCVRKALAIKVYQNYGEFSWCSTDCCLHWHRAPGFFTLFLDPI